MASRSEQILRGALRPILARLPIGATLEDSNGLRDVRLGLEYFLPEVLGELYSEWRFDWCDGVYPTIARKTGDDEVEFFGLCILITDQTLVPFHSTLQIDPCRDEVSWIELRLGEKLTGEPGETGKHGKKRLPYSSLNSALIRMYRLDSNPDLIDWVYKVTFGEKR